MDIALAQEEEARRKAEEAQSQLRPPMVSARSHETADHQTQTTSSLPDTGIIDHNSELGTSIGGYDPFEHAFIQPALRANPRARPEQPFPPAQLGREEALFGRMPTSSSGDSDMLDSGATVRLKSLNQQDRRLVNRWWNDQLQRAGPQNIIAILTGEECGTLTIGQRANLTESAPLPVENHNII
mmetsp:Transcript_41852/g.64466  ORF Transcript_41852/g.64466 Transcript_41852/m.64466 type:complete len:184 (-) Transcript_41852:104-655(-)